MWANRHPPSNAERGRLSSNAERGRYGAKGHHTRRSVPRTHTAPQCDLGSPGGGPVERSQGRSIASTMKPLSCYFCSRRSTGL